MTDFRRPDLDLWEEEEDAEDARPTIVSERPAAPQLSKPTKSADATIPFGTIQVDRKTPEMQRSGLVRRLIEQGALEDDGMPGNTAEALRDSEVELLKLPSDPGLDAVVMSATARKIEGVETEPASEDQVPTVSVKRPLPPHALELTEALASAQVSDKPAQVASPFADREITERISVSTGMVGSIAPATRTFRPEPRERKGLRAWQTALAALVLLGGGISLAKFRAEQRKQSSALSAQPANVAPHQEGPRAVEPAVVRDPSPSPDSVPVAEAPNALPEPAVAPSVAEVPAPAQTAPMPEQALDSAPLAPEQVGPPLPKHDETIVPVSRTRRVRERTAIAGASEPAAQPDPLPAPVAPKSPVAPSQSLPAVPSREQVASSLDAVTSELRKCVGDRHGLAEVSVTVRPAGFVSYAVVSGEYAGTTEGSCIARAVRSAKFPPFSEPVLRVTYPFQL